MAQIASIKGLDKLKAKFEKLKRKKAKAFQEALKMCAALLLGYSLPLVPLWRGFLRASGSIEVEGSGFQTRVFVGYFGVPYAVYVHEVMPPESNVTHGAAFNAKWKAKIKSVAKWRKKHGLGKSPYWFNRGPKQQAKFLEGPMREHADEFRNLIRTEMMS